MFKHKHGDHMTVKRIKAGLTFRAHYADSNPKWEVIKSLGGSWLCRITKDELDYAGTEKSFLSSEILQSISFAEYFTKALDKDADYLQNQKPGTILHYHNSFGSYVRKEIVLHEGRKKLKSIALVGNWSKNDLPSRQQNGEIYHPYHVKQILEQELTDRVNGTSIYENPSFVKPGGSNNSFDPRKCDPISLDLPPLEGDAKTSTELWTLLERVQEKINPQTEELRKEGNKFDPKTPMNRLRAAYDLLEPIFAESED